MRGYSIVFMASLLVLRYADDLLNQSMLRTDVLVMVWLVFVNLN
jgi:hypothetical protein